MPFCFERVRAGLNGTERELFPALQIVETRPIIDALAANGLAALMMTGHNERDYHTMTYFARSLGGNQHNVGRTTFDNTAKLLTEDDLRRIAPSVFATDAHESRSLRFKPIPTWEVLQGLMAEGFMPVGAKQATAREPGKAPYTKHLIRLRKVDDHKKFAVGDTVCEALLRNANDGTASYELLSSLFRIRCLNSMVSFVGDVASAKVRHSGDVQGKVIEATYSVLETSHMALSAPEDWSRMQLDRHEKEAFAKAAHVLRFADADGELHTPVEPQQLLAPRRQEDAAADLWTTFNVVQENAIKGGVKNWIRGEDGRQLRRYTSRAVNGIDQDVKLNKALWVLAQELAKHKR